MINSRSYFAPVGSSDFESPLKPRQASQVRRSLTGSFSGPISDEELKQSFKAMRQSGSHPTAAGSPVTSIPLQDDEQAGVGIYFVKNDSDGKFFVQHILPGYAAEKCGSIVTGDVVTHVGTYKLPPDLTLERLRPLIVRANFLQSHRPRIILLPDLTCVAGGTCWHQREPHVSARV